MVYITLANGFEEIEALAFYDILKRAQIDAKLVTITDDMTVTGAHGISVNTELSLIEIEKDKIEAVVLPGGMPGTTNLDNCNEVKELLVYCNDNNIYIGAICAAPSVLGHLGLLNSKKATCFPGFENELAGAEITGEKVTMDGNIITAKGAGCAHDFAFEFVKLLKGKDLASEIRNAMQY